MTSLATHWRTLDEINGKRGKTGADVLAAAQQATSTWDWNNQRIADEAEHDLGTASTTMIIGLSIGVLIRHHPRQPAIKAIATPVYKGVDFAKITAGDLTAEVDVDQKDELGILAQALHPTTWSPSCLRS